MFEIFVYFRERKIFFHVRNIRLLSRNFFFFHARSTRLFSRKKNPFSCLKYSFIFAKKKPFFMFEIFVYFREKKIFTKFSKIHVRNISISLSICTNHRTKNLLLLKNSLIKNSYIYVFHIRLTKTE